MNENSEINPLNKKLSQNSGTFIERMIVLGDAAQSLLCKLYELYNLGDNVAKSASPKVKQALLAKFPEHPGSINLQKYDKAFSRKVKAEAANMKEYLEPWYHLLVDVRIYYDSVIQVLTELHLTLTSARSESVSSLVKGLAQMISDVSRVQILLAATPHKLLIQLYALVFYYCSHAFGASGDDGNIPAEHELLVLYITKFESVIPTLQQDLYPFTEALQFGIKTLYGPYVSIWRDMKKMKDFRVFSADKVSPSISHFAKSPQQLCEGLTKAKDYQDWILWSLLVCPELFSDKDILGIAQICLQDSMILKVFREITLWIHAEYIVHSYPKLKEILKRKKIPREEIKVKMKETISSSFRYACEYLADNHMKRREYALHVLQQNIGRLSDPTRVTINDVLHCLASLYFARSEVMWYFTHIQQKIPKGLPNILFSPQTQPFDALPSVLIWELISAMKKCSDVILQNRQTLSALFWKVLVEHASTFLNMVDNISHLKQPVLVHSLQRIVKLGFGGFNSEVGDIEGMRITWLRFTVYLCQLKMKSVDEYTLKKYNTTIYSTMSDLINATYLIDKLDVQLVKAISLKEVFFYQEKFHSIVSKSLNDDLSIGQHLQGLLELVKMFLDNNHPNCVVISDETVAESVQSILEMTAVVIKKILLKMIDEGYAICDKDYGMQRKISVTGSAKKGKASKDKISAKENLFDLLDDKCKAPSLLGHFKMLSELVDSLLDYKDFQATPKFLFHPRAYLFNAFKEAFEIFLKKVVDSEDFLPNPSLLHSKIIKFTTLLESFSPNSVIDVGKIVKEVLSVELPQATNFKMPIGLPHGNVRENCLTTRYAKWFISHIILDQLNDGILYSHRLKGFSTSQHRGLKTVHFANSAELSSYLRVFGLYGTVAIWNEIKMCITSTLNNVLRELKNNQAFIAEVVFATNQQSGMESLLNLKEKSLLLDYMLMECITLGRCLHFLDMLKHSAWNAFNLDKTGLIESLVESFTGQDTFKLEESDLHQLNLMCHAFGGKVEGPNPVLQAAYQSINVSNISLDLLEHLFASLMCHSIWHNLQYFPESEALDKDIFGVATAFRQVCYVVENCKAGTFVEEDHININRRFQNFLKTACPLIYLNESEAQPKLIFLEYILDGYYFSKSTLEEYVPSLLIKSAKQKYIEAL